MEQLSPYGRPKRARRMVGPGLMSPLRLLFRFSHSRDAYVLRLIGDRWGPVLRRAPASRQARRLVDVR